ncbi:unnamed protein product [Caenorhabditis auriculariae]|uniref:Strictosidine synthase conserved region domain-containing protein n=1 Tax=Caenorhabditis auriculariae TaxID=2777116 RepID=A0A8S1HU49_9PELO|nr:unnamed protein product [Caenorhabditis auriculariae]
MGTMGKVFIYGLIGLVVSWAALYVRYSNEENRDARKYRLPSPPELVGPLEPNQWLESPQYILKGKIDGPESIEVDDEAIYASLVDGRVVKIVDGEIVAEVRFSKERKGCGKFDMEPTCGRPLGIRKLDGDRFVVVDAYLGIFLVDFAKQPPSFEQVYKSSTPIQGRVPRFLNDIDVLNNDEIVFSDSSYKHDRRHFMLALLEQSSNGRIIHYKLSTRKATVLLENLYFPNGVQLFADKKSLLFAECGMARIKRLWLDSKKVEIFAANLPGMPDNIRLDKEGFFWVGLAAVRQSKASSLFDVLGPLPGIRQFLIDIVPARLWKPMLSMFKKPHALVVALDQKGEVVRSLHDTTGKFVEDVSQATPWQNSLYLGSFHSPYIAKINL